MMLFLEVLFIGLILSADSFSAAIAMGFRPFTRKDAIRFALSSGGAEALVALVGALAGKQIVKIMGEYDHWIAFGLLMIVALHMAYEGILHIMRPEETEEKKDFHSFIKVLIVSFATSLDALGVGVGLGVMNKPIIPYIISIGLWAFIATIVGLNIAKKISNKFGPIVNVASAIVLGFLAFQMLKI